MDCLGLLIFTSPYLLAQSKQAIEVKEAYKYVGETQIVCGRIVSTKYLKRASWGPIFLNYGRDYPDQQMTGLIWFGRFSEYFSYKPEKFLKRKNVCVKKIIIFYFTMRKIYVIVNIFKYILIFKILK